MWSNGHAPPRVMRTPANLDFDARVPIPFSVFPSSYRSDAVTESTEVRVGATLPAQPARVGREGHETRYSSYSAALPNRKDRRYEEHVYEEDRVRRPGRGEEEIHIHEEDRIHAPRGDKRFVADIESNIDVAERDFRQRTTPFDREYTQNHYTDQSTQPRQFVEQGYPPPAQEEVRVEASSRTIVEPSEKHKRDMGYYDEDGHYHSLRHGLHRAADRILHPIHGGSHHRRDRDEDDVVVEQTNVSMSAPRASRESVRYVERGGPPMTITIPCHHIRIGDLLILQGRPCQIIRITTSAQTGQHRYLGVDLFTKQLHEESSFVSNPSPSVIVQNMLGPVFKQYRVLDIRDDGRVVAMTETGDVKQGLPVLDQSSLLARLTDAFNNGRGSVRVLVINDDGRELAVDYKVVHGSRL
ncbi:woronin body major protein [Cryomyces antarcticus]